MWPVMRATRFKHHHPHYQTSPLAQAKCEPLQWQLHFKLALGISALRVTHGLLRFQALTTLSCLTTRNLAAHIARIKSIRLKPIFLVFMP